MNNKYSFVRMGAIPTVMREIDYMKLSSEQVDFINSYDGVPEKAVEYAMKNMRIFSNLDSSELFINGISVFNADEAGLPIIENIDQARLLASKIGYAAYWLNGKIIGKGHDQEPIITDTSGEQIKIDDETLQDIIIKYLSDNFQASGSKDQNEKQSTIYSFYDINIHKHYLKYMGIRFD